jgi:tRNA1(Val) A37 N6-methylase TrmN6
MNNDLQKFKKCDVFTPQHISNLMASKLHKTGTLLEPSAGIGNLLQPIDINAYTQIDVYELKTEYLDLIKYTNINKYNTDFIKAEITQKYDNIIMNPPYIKVQDLSEEYRLYLKTHFDILKDGLVDIYYAFIIKCLDLLSDDGIMVSITPNSYLYNKSSLKLRQFLFDNSLIQEIIDYKDQKVFNGVSVYCCITVFTKKPKDTLIYNDNTILYSDLIKNYSLFNFNSSNKTLRTVCKITNGIATLRDKIFIHETKLFDEPCWYSITNGATNKFIIYPYNDAKIIPEDIFKTHNPLTFQYLLENKHELSLRDKGNKVYPEWFAYGRSQSIKYSNTKCIYISCFIDPANINNALFVKKGMLHHGCLCIQPNDEKYIDQIVNCIKHNIDFISNNSSKRSGGWINLSSRVLYDVPLQ